MSATEFREFARSHGYELPADIAPGKRVRFPTNGKSFDDAGWAKLFEDEKGGIVGDWRTGAKHVWQAKRAQQFSADEYREWQSRVDREKREAEAQREADANDGARRAAKIWESSSEALDDHPYLKRKSVGPNGARVYKGPQLVIRAMDCDGALIVALRNSAGLIRSLEFINPEGEKRFLPGASLAGTYFGIGSAPLGSEPLAIAEGFATAATVHEATGHSAVAAMAAGNMELVARALRDKYRSARLIVCADDDAGTQGNPGLVKAREAAIAVRGLLAVPDFGRDRPDGATDFNDLLKANGAQAVAACIASAKSQVQPEKASAEVKRREFPVVWLDEAQMPEYAPAIVKGLLDHGALGLIYGESGCGKTFFTADLFSHVACGMAWRGRKVQRGLVAYVAVEAGTAILKRFVAWRDRRLSGATAATTPLAILTRGPNLLDGVDVAALLQQLRALGEQAGAPVLAVVFDTLSRSIPGGDENKSEDMTSLIEVANRIRDELSAATVLVHHTGKDPTKGARGHSSLFAAADLVLAVSDGYATVEKLRDGVAGERFPFRLQVVELGTDSDGDALTTCIVDHAEPEAGPPKRNTERLSGVGQIALQALQEAIGEYGEALPETSTIPRGVRGLTLEQWRTRFALRYGSDGDGDQRDRKTVKKAFQRGREALLKAGLAGVSNPYVWLL